MAWDYTPVEETNLPRYVKYNGRKVRVLGYQPKTEHRAARFIILNRHDQQVAVRREHITFIKE